jgi:murein DD-endopeptidase MepM/ murein hydrolase activator NlpD
MRRRMRLRLLVVVAALPLVLWAALPLASSGAPRNIQGKIEEKRRQLESKKRQERVLASHVATWDKRINALQGDITTLQRRQVRIQADLDAKRAELARVQERLRQARMRLARLKARLAEARRALSVRLVELYKADQPDIVTVILDSNGFADLLERTEFMKRVSDQDARILDNVRTAQIDATKTEKTLDSLERRQQRVAAVILARRNQVAEVKGRLIDRRQNYEVVRGRKSSALSSVREDRHALEGHIDSLVREQARVAAALRNTSAGSGASGSAGPVHPGSSGLVWPVNGPIVSPFGPRWGRLHAGVDISAPTGTPIRAAAAGTVVLLGWVGGYGNYTCIGHGGGLSTCYAHQSSYATSQGASVSQGQVIGSVGCTGHCYGDHLHFETRINGNPVNPAGYL